MAPRLSRSVAYPLRSALSIFLSFLLTAFSIPSRSFAAGSAPAPTTNSPENGGPLKSAAQMRLFQLQTKLDLARRAAISVLHPPSEFERLKSQFEEPLFATGPRSPKEDEALLESLKSFHERKVEDDFTSLTAFLSDYPHSAWSLVLLTNLGLLDYHYGYFSRAIDAFDKAWTEGRELRDPHAKLLVDRAVGELAEMHARLGHVDALDTLFKELGNRPITGSATEKITAAREGLATMHRDPGVSFLCGPYALKNLLLSEHFTYRQVAFLDDARSGPQGFSLRQVSELADRADAPHTVVYREAGQPVPVPSVIHWRVAHFAAIVGKQGDRFHLIDPTFGSDLWITQSAIDAESDGYFLALGRQQPFAWRKVSVTETSRVRGMGDPQQTEPGAYCPCDTQSQTSSSANSSNPGNDSAPTSSTGSAPTSPMATYSFTEMIVNLHITDTPVGYAPPKGPSVRVTLNYNQREAFQPATFSYFNIGQKWTLNWLSYIVDDPNAPGASVARYVAGGGYIYEPSQVCVYQTGTCENYNPATGVFPPETRDASVLSRSITGPIVYHRSLQDGSVETYAASNGATSIPRLIFLTKITDPAGNSVSLNYDNQQRLISLTDATGRETTFSYDLPGSPLVVTKITDPFGRSAELTYDASGRLIQITDILGIKSQFAYDVSSLIDAMTTPYGTTTFTYGQNGTYRYLTATDPLGHTERLEWNQPVSTLIIPYSLPNSLVPSDVIGPWNQYMNYRDTFYWDKHAYAVAAGDYTKARVRHWLHLLSNINVMYHALESYQEPLENRVWFNYPGQDPNIPGAAVSGTLDLPSRVVRLLDDGTQQLVQISYNAQGHVTDMTDPVGRETQFTYAANGIDLLTAQQRTSASGFSTIAQFTYNDQHFPLTYTDAAGQTTSFAYNSAGQLTQMTDALAETTQYQYDGLGYLDTIVNANGKTQASFTYDQYGDVATATDSEGYTVAYLYDAADRVTQETFPDSTTRKYAYTNLDLTSVTDRQDNTTKYAYDLLRDLVSAIDPLNHVTRFGYWENQSLKTLTDPKGNTTSWDIDVQNRVTSKQYADGTLVTNTYENTTSRLHSITDAMAQVKTFTYAEDNSLTNITYANALNPTPNVAFGYDPYFQRITSMTDGNGTRNYTYRPVGSLGALQLLKESGPYTNDSIAYAYDPLGRLSSRTVDTSTETFAYDKLSRLVKNGTTLGTFNLTYLGQTGQITNQQIATGTVGTNWTYLSNLFDRRLASINNTGATRSFNLATTPENFITQIQESAPRGSVWAPKTLIYKYDDAYRLTNAESSAGTYAYGVDPADNITSFQSPSGTTDVSYNNLNQIVNYGSYTYVYDKNGNVLDDGLRTYTWDAENRLLSVTSKSNSSLKSSFLYDGLGRRTAIDSTNGMTSETRYLWCGEQLCQARTSSDTVERRYYSEGEYLPLGGTSLYYSHDQLGSVRDVLATQNGSRVAEFDYDPYGNAIQSSEGEYGFSLRWIIL